MWPSLRKLSCILDRGDLKMLTRLLIVVCGLVLLELAGVFSVLPFMQLVANPEVVESNRWLNWLSAKLSLRSHREIMIWMGCAVLGLYALTAVGAVLSSWLIQKTIWSIGHRISMRLINRYACLPFEFFLTHTTSDMVKKAISDIHELVVGVLLAGVQFIANAFKSFVILSLLFLVNPALAFFAFVILGGSYILIHIVRHRFLESLGYERQVANSLRLKSYTETLSGIRTLRVSGATAWFIQRFEGASRRFAQLQPIYRFYTVFPRHLIELLAFGGIVGFVLYMLLTDADLLAVIPILTVFAMATYKLMPSLSQAFGQAASISHHLPAIDAVHEDMHDAWTLLKPAQQYVHASPLPFRHQLVLENVCFQYASSGIPVLQEINLEIPKAGKCAFVGSTGCGKSTLIDIMVGLLSPTSGKFYVDAAEVTLDNVFGWQKIIAYVPQDVFLCNDTIAANIALGIPADQVDQELLRKAARLAQVDEFVETEWREGYETMVGERGVQLSGGQRQRIGLARVFYRKPDVLFLDEATSALDAITEEAIVSAIQSEMPDVTVVMVAHRLSSIRFCDQVMLIDGGRLVGHGSFDELMKSNAKFRQMVEVTE